MIHGVLIDLEGVLYVGGYPLPGAREALLSLRAAGIPMRFITNTSRTTRAAIVDRLADMGLEVAPEHLFTPVVAARNYLIARKLTPHLLVHPHILGEFADLLGPSPDAVLIGDAGSAFDYGALNRCFRLLLDGLPLLAMGSNRYFRDDGGLSLDIGPFVAALEYAAEMEAAGADGLEMNVFWIPADIRLRGEEVEARYLEIIRAVKAVVQIPVAFKLNPYFSGIAHFADQVSRNGADALVLFNRFYQPDFDIHKLKVLHNLRFSDAAEIRLPLLWIAVLYHRIGASLAATTGVQSANEVVKYLLAGADVAMTASALYKYGIGYLKNMHHDLKEWMQEMGFTSVEAFKGVMSQQNISDPVAYERANYIHILENAKP